MDAGSWKFRTMLLLLLFAKADLGGFFLVEGSAKKRRWLGKRRRLRGGPSSMRKEGERANELKKIEKYHCVGLK